MKKFYLSLIAAAAMMPAMAATIDCGEGQSYTTLNEAAGAVTANGDIINLTGNTTNTDRIIPANGKVFTLEGNGYTVDRTFTDGNKFTIGNENSGAVFTFKNVTFTATSQPNKYYFNFKDNRPGKFENVTISGVRNTNGDADLSNRSILRAFGPVDLAGIKFVNCTLGEDNYHVYANAALNLSGDNGGTIIYVASGAKVNASDLTNTTPIYLVLGGQAEGDVMVYGCTDLSKFEIKGDVGELAVSGDNLVVTGLSKEEDTKDAVYNETKGKNYANLVDAVSAAGDGDVILVHADQNFTARLGCGSNNITIKGDNGVTLTNTANTIIFLANVKNGGSFTLENLIIDGGGRSGDKTVIEASESGAKIFLNNVTIKNITTTNGQGIICNKGGSTVSLENVTIENCTVPEGRGTLFVGTNNCTLKGDNAVSVFMQNYALNCQDLTNSAAIMVTLEQVSEDKTYINGCDDTTKFKLTNDGYKFFSNGEGGLKAVDSTYTGIADVEVEENGVVEYYNLQGVRMASDNLPAGIYLRRAGSKTTKVYVK